MKTQTHQITVNNRSYLVQGKGVRTLKELADIIGLNYQKIEPTPISEHQSLIKVWSIGELKDHLDSKEK